jgi:hypothetical protein
MVSKYVVISAAVIVLVVVVIVGALVLTGSGNKNNGQSETEWPGFYDYVYYNNSTETIDGLSNAPFVSVQLSLPVDESEITIIPLRYALDSNGTEYYPEAYSWFANDIPVKDGVDVETPITVSPGTVIRIDLRYTIPTQMVEYIFSFNYFGDPLPIERFPGEEDYI